MKKKKVFISSYNLDFGGIERSLLTLLKAFNYNKYEVTLTLENKDGIYLKEVPKEVMIQEYKVSTSKIMFLRKIFNMIKRVLFIIKNHNKYEASICFATYSIPCSFMTRVASTNTIYFIHSNYKYIYPNEKDLRYFFDIRHINKFKHIVFVSNESKNDLIKMYPEIKNKSVVINNLIDYKSIIKLSQEKIDLEYSKKKIFLFVGRLDESSKKISRIINVANRFQENNKVLFLIIGDGPDKLLYKRLIDNNKLNNIKMLGAKVNPYPYIKACDYLLLTSDYEGFPVVYNEAIVLNKPILTTIDVTDDLISIPSRFGMIMDKNEESIFNNINSVLKKDFVIKEKVDFNNINNNRMNKIERLVEDVND